MPGAVGFIEEFLLSGTKTQPPWQLIIALGVKISEPSNLLTLYPSDKKNEIGGV